MGIGLTVGDDLDADDVARLEEVLPAFDGVGGTGQLLDAPVEGGLDRGGVAGAVAGTSPGFVLRRHGRDKDQARPASPVTCRRPPGASPCRCLPILRRRPMAVAAETSGTAAAEALKELAAVHTATRVAMLHGLVRYCGHGGQRRSSLVAQRIPTE